MRQISFSDQSNSEFSKLEQTEKMELVNRLSYLTHSPTEVQNSDVSEFTRNHKDYFRVRHNELRVYLEIKEEGELFCHYILPKHTFGDFLFRSNMPVSKETDFEKTKSFWDFLESLKP